jgi:Uri superfamily endonuclease
MIAHELSAAAAINTLPRDPGTYALLLCAHQHVSLQVGKLGSFYLPAGAYVYVGSALGSGGIRARVSRHLRDSRRTYWHIDALLHECVMEGVCWVITEDRLECTWVRALLNLPGAFAPITGFGSSDCSNGCPSHLVKLERQPGTDAVVNLTAALLPQSSFFPAESRLLEDQVHAETVLFP